MFAATKAASVFIAVGKQKQGNRDAEWDDEQENINPDGT